MSSVEEFRTEVRSWLRAHLTGEFAALKGRGGPGREHEAFAERLAWKRHMAAHGALAELARRNGAVADPLIRDRLVQAWIGLEAMRATALRPGTAPSTAKLHWARWHRDLGELAMDVCAAPSLLAAGAHGDPYDLDDWQRLFLFSRADTVYAGSDEIQRTLIAEPILGLPKEVRA
ncbi:acyl-CoA dehydrogenase family protein [Streptomyces sp. 147326]|uniref:acyl-CoA dehydrogenase family protein n=1 Tax=Streptomyces sp. 147326 TaxID=3074379 RepID=UPI0038579CFA